MQFPWKFTAAERKSQILIDSNNVACGFNVKRFQKSGLDKCVSCDQCELPSHMLNACKRRLEMGFYNKRHDGALDVLDAGVCVENVPNLVKKRKDQTPEAGINQGSLRPDMTIFLKKGIVAVADVKCYWPSANATVSVHERNVTKYHAIATGYQNRTSIEVPKLSLSCCPLPAQFPWSPLKP